jgi:hypothetical protein
MGLHVCLKCSPEIASPEICRFFEELLADNVLLPFRDGPQVKLCSAFGSVKNEITHSTIANGLRCAENARPVHDACILP